MSFRKALFPTSEKSPRWLREVRQIRTLGILGLEPVEGLVGAVGAFANRKRVGIENGSERFVGSQRFARTTPQYDLPKTRVVETTLEVSIPDESKTEDHPEPIGDLVHRRGLDRADPPIEPGFREGADLLDHRETRLDNSPLGRLEGDMGRENPGTSR